MNPTTTPDNPPACEKTLLDEIAIKALCALLAHPSWTPNPEKGPSGSARYAAQAYLIADAMLTERNRRAES